MKWKHRSVEEIAASLQRVRRTVEGGHSVEDALRAETLPRATYYRWLARYGELGVREMSRVQRLERENARLRRVLRDIEIEGALGV